MQKIFITIYLVLVLGTTSQSAATNWEITQTQAMARVRTILSSNSGPCRITQTQDITAARVKTGWRVAAKIKISGTLENAIWIISSANGAVPQNQLTTEIENGCP